MAYINPEEIKRVFYGMQKTMQNLNLVDNKLSITPQGLMDYIVASCPDVIFWDSEHYDDYVLDMEEDPEQTQALNDLEGMKLEMNLFATFNRILGVKRKDDR